MIISFLGDIMLGRFVSQAYKETKHNIISDDIVAKLKKSDFRIANLESPFTTLESKDSLRFAANKELVKQLKWIDCFSLSNNHINDFENDGMVESIRVLSDNQIPYNGLYIDDYNPFIFEKDNQKIAIVTCTDMMNHEFDESCPYKTLRVNNPEPIIESIHRCKSNGYFTILFAHIGMLFSRFPSPSNSEFLHKIVDEGADCIVTVHSHCLGCHEVYKGVHIFHSIGDFLMDGASFRRRKACILNLSINGNALEDWSIIPTVTTDKLITELPSTKEQRKIISRYNKTSLKLATNILNYERFYKRQYKMEILAHSLSTVRFELKRRGFIGLLKILRVRIYDVLGMVRRVTTDRSKMSYDSDAVGGKHTMSNDDIK